MFIYETHCHTSEGSLCGKASGKEMAEFYKSMGLTGIVITDHFFNGNCAVPKELLWKERVELFCKGYESAKKRGDEIGLDVFFGWECSFNGGDILTYGLKKEWLLDHEDCDKLEPNDYFDLVHKSGGYVIHAHPFRERSYIKCIQLWPREVDAVEVYNAANSEFENDIAVKYADHYELPYCAGSDNHKVGINQDYGYVELDFKAKNTEEIAKAVVQRRIKTAVFHKEDEEIRRIR